METDIFKHIKIIIYEVYVCKNDKATYLYTPRNEVVGGYTGFTMAVRPSVDKSYVVR